MSFMENSFMENWFSILPNDIQAKIMLDSPGFHPDPVFQKGSIVTFTASKQNEFKKVCDIWCKAKYNMPMPPCPHLYKLFISEEPTWDRVSKTYEYHYKYNGGTAGGCAIEKYLMAVDGYTLSYDGKNIHSLFC